MSPPSRKRTRKPRKGARMREVDMDDAAYHAFPESLIESAQDTQLTSPVKAQRQVGPQKRVPSTPAKTKQREHEEQATVMTQADDGLDSAFNFQGLDAIPGPDFGSIAGGSGAWASDPEEDDFADYVDSLSSQIVQFNYLHGSLFVVQGWDSTKHQATTSWFHLQFQTSDDGQLDSGCTCPKALNRNLCVHRRYFRDYEVESLISRDVADDPEDRPPATLFSRRVEQSVRLTSLFSVQSMSSSELKGRAIVTHTVSSAESTWKCNKDQGMETCFHIKTAQEEYGDLSVDEVAELEEIGSSSADSVSVSDLVRGPGNTVSYLPIHPPLWARLPSDIPLYADPPPMRTPPNITFPLDAESSCSCPSGRTYFNDSLGKKARLCHLYTLTSVYSVQVDQQDCPTCPSSRKRRIGPDLRQYGIFNYNNSILVSHELLDEYTSSFTSSDYTFKAWYKQLSRRYSLTGRRFMGDDAWRAVWFSYVSLQHFGDKDMTCTTCGPAPDTVIWDGITLAFGRKHLRGSLRPPTTTGLASPVRQNVKYNPRQQLLLVAGMRKRLRAALQGPPLEGLNLKADIGADPPLPTDLEDPGEAKSEAAARRRRALEIDQHLDRVESMVGELNTQCPALAQIFDEHFGAEAYSTGRKPSAAFKNLFLQIAAEESVLQMVNYSSLLKLRSFLESPTRDNVNLLMSIPAFYKTARLKTSDLKSLVEVMRWVEQKARDVLKVLILDPNLPAGDPHLFLDDDNDWRKTGCYYSMPQIRQRPIYIKLKQDQQKDKSTKRGDRCGKYYSQYGERRLTGGIMVCWCSHSICYGFHCIPSSEGRDDVFSAMVTRWPKAPTRVIYDFACALGPYCMLREPMFFAETSFAIDIFHATGHSKCSPAAFLSEYMNVDTRLSYINSSAAECGNGALRRIRKSVSYMGQQRAIIYTKVFLSIWNRAKILKLDD
ncbi:hypothetical protein DFP72DRAFT_819007 [Ephemerocybe angulata]|uniref:HMG domain-containing protein n=1 Tax=Ephemerocybe angulata TaxID=980116 RepID=A0A8H6HNE6_9AGAR|nr:hypothetical protein DFP72DRAFT_819007 [Tulosesus angulatus]